MYLKFNLGMLSVKDATQIRWFLLMLTLSSVTAVTALRNVRLNSVFSFAEVVKDKFGTLKQQAP
jgi:hypothetical protein